MFWYSHWKIIRRKRNWVRDLIKIPFENSILEILSSINFWPNFDKNVSTSISHFLLRNNVNT